MVRWRGSFLYRVGEWRFVNVYDEERGEGAKQAFGGGVQLDVVVHQQTLAGVMDRVCTSYLVPN